MSSDHQQPPNPYDEASWLSTLFFIWPEKLVKLGASKILVQEDLPRVSVKDDAQHLYELVWRHWQVEQAFCAKKNRRPNFPKAITLAFLELHWHIGFLLLAETPLRLTQTYFLGRLVTYFLEDTTSGIMGNGFFLSSMVILCGLAVTMLHHHYYLHSWLMGMQLRVASSALVYRKALKLHLHALTSMATSHVVNILSVDVEKFQQAGIFVHYVWHAPFEALCVLAFGIYLLGIAFFVGFILILLLVPLQYRMSKRFAKLRRQVAILTDTRIKLTTQAIGGARQMKYMGWEGKFGDSIREQRRLEIAKTLKANYLRALNEAIFFLSNSLVAFVTFVTYWGLGNTLSLDKILVTLLLFYLVQFGMTKFFSNAVQSLAEGYISGKRIQYLLEQDEVDTTSRIANNDIPDHNPSLHEVEMMTGYELTQMSGSDHVQESLTTSDGPVVKQRACVVSLQNVTCMWNAAQSDDKSRVSVSPNTLSHVNLNVWEGELVAIVGPVGSSKSSLLMAILQELEANVTGSVNVRGSIAYASQEPWIQSTTVRENILFGSVFDEQKYQAVVKACALVSDFKMLQHGDLTMIGDRGVNLSGGQKARIALARMAYTDASIYVMDDPLSAVDPAVGRQLFDEVICKRLAASTRILVTHQLQYLSSPHVTRVVSLKGGTIHGIGTYNELSTRGTLISDAQLNGEGHEMRKRQPSAADSVEEVKPNATRKIQQQATGLIIVEDKESGSLGLNTYVSYARAGGGMVVCWVVFLLMIAGQLFSMGTNIWLIRWARKDKNAQRQLINVWVYLGLILACILASISRALFAFHVSLVAGRTLHNNMLQAILRAPILFFDSNPLGRILNRFSKDTGFLDDMLPMTWYDFLQCMFMVMGSVLIVCVINPLIFVSLVPLAVYFYYLRYYFIKTSREVKRIEAVSRSPIFSFLSETMDGLPIIRAFGASDRFAHEFIHALNENTRGYFAFVATSRWLGFRLDMICVLLLIVSTYVSVAVFQTHFININPGLLGLGIMYIIQLAGLFQWMVRQSVEVENQMVSVERVLSYCQVAPEPALESLPEYKPPSNWPTGAEVVCHELVVRHRPELDPVLKGLTFSIAARERVGIVGRTGAGKSSLISSLFRLMEADQGFVTIDGIDIKNLGLHDLRPRLCVIPQAPFLFAGTVRQNLDPFSIHTDERLWAALSDVQMNEAVSSLPEGLSSDVSDSGSNFSVGQRQLLCMARAILQHSKLLIMDEATANVDLETDGLIQRTVRTKFSDCTVLMVAHRLRTIIDCDKILVLSHGSLLEDGHPHELLLKHYPVPPSIVIDMQKHATILDLLVNNRTTLESALLEISGSESDISPRDTTECPKASFAGMVQETGASSCLSLRKMAYLHYVSSQLRGALHEQLEAKSEAKHIM